MVLLIAHRPELVRHVDRIVSLGGGSAALRSEAR
jgi:ABC-type multidrug transport system fused ATPase/permease subunit